MNFTEIFGLLHIIFYTCLGIFIVGRAAIRGFRTTEIEIQYKRN